MASAILVYPHLHVFYINRETWKKIHGIAKQLNMCKFDIPSIAIIGVGPGGLASLYEFLHTNKDGSSTEGSVKSTDPKFPKVVAFEQKDNVGGIWATSGEDSDLPIPPQNLLDTESYANPDIIHPSQPIPDNLQNTSVDKPVTRKLEPIARELEWNRSGVFPGLFTNTPSRFTRFSYLPNEATYLNKSRTIYPFLSHKELSKRLTDFVDKEG